MYYYTPYQPNAAALNNLYGLGDSCSSYGNRNFWRLWHDWFGDPTSGVVPNALVSHGSTTYFVANGERWLINDNSLLDTYQPFGPVSQVSQAYVSQHPLRGDLGRAVRDSEGTVYLVDGGKRFTFVDCDQVEVDFGMSCTDIPTLTDQQLGHYSSGGDVTTVLTSNGAGTYLISDGVRREILDDESAHDILGGAASSMALTVTNGLLVSIPYGQPILREGAAFTIRHGSQDLRIVMGPDDVAWVQATVHHLDPSLWFDHLLALDAGSNDKIPTTHAIPALYSPAGSTTVLALAPTGSVVVDPDHWIDSAPEVAADVAALVPDSGLSITGPAIVRDSSMRYPYLIMDRQRYAVGSAGVRAHILRNFEIPDVMISLVDSSVHAIPLSAQLVPPSGDSADSPPVTDVVTDPPPTEPEPTTTPPPPAAPKIHTVVSGDTVWALSRRYGTTVDAIISLNRLTPTALIRVGQKLTIPSSGSSTSSSSGSSTGSSTTTKSTITHTVVAGDTVWALSRKYGSTVDAIIKANNLNSNALIRVGQKLKIPLK